MQWNPDGKFFASGDYGSDAENIESLLQFWGEDGNLLKSMHGSKAEYRNARWSPDGEFLASASDALRVWTREGKEVHLGESPELLWGLDWDRKANSIITSSKAGRIRIWTAQAKVTNEIIV